jgi:hypothetical protein
MLAFIELIQKRACRGNRRFRPLEAKQMPIARDDRIHSLRSREGDEVVIAGIRGQTWRWGWIVAKNGEPSGGPHETMRLIDRGVPAKLLAHQDALQLGQKVR